MQQAVTALPASTSELTPPVGECRKPLENRPLPGWARAAPHAVMWTRTPMVDVDFMRLLPLYVTHG
jgi:hypothetical protein